MTEEKRAQIWHLDELYFTEGQDREAKWVTAEFPFCHHAVFFSLKMSNLFILKRKIVVTMVVMEIFQLRSIPVVSCPCVGEQCKTKIRPGNWTLEGLFTLSISLNAVTLLAILLWLNCLDFLIHEVSNSKKWLATPNWSGMMQVDVLDKRDLILVKTNFTPPTAIAFALYWF